MLETYSYSTKLKWLLGGSIIFTFAAYQLAFAKTIHLYSKQQELTQQLAQSQTVEQDIANLQRTFQAQQSAQQKDFDEEWIFEVFTMLCRDNDMVIMGLERAERYLHEQHEVITNKVVLEGNFANALRVMDAVEHEFRLGMVVAAQFDKRRNRETKQNELVTIFYLRNIQPLDNEKSN